MLEFDYIRLLFVIFISFLALKIMIGSEKKNALFFVMIIVFVFFYSGFGGCLTEANPHYIIYYIIYLLVLSITIRTSRLGVKFSVKDDNLFDSYIKNNGRRIMIIYFLLSLSTLVYPEFKLFRLVSPPSPDVYAIMEQQMAENTDVISSLLYLARTFMLPFFYWALYRYRGNLITFGFFLFIDMYITYCRDAYIGRYPILVALIIIIVYYWRKGSYKTKVVMMTAIIVSVPTMAYLFYQYTFLRHGASLDVISSNEAISVLLSQEIGYPLLFDQYKNYFDISLFPKYLEWIVFLPLPGFLKFGLGDYPSDRFTYIISGLTRGEYGFSVYLPGIVGESYFICGPYLFFLHAILLGLLVKTIFTSLKELKSMTFVFIYYMVILSFQLSRGGTLSVYPLIFKHFLILLLFLLYIRKSYKVKI